MLNLGSEKMEKSLQDIANLRDKAFAESIAHRYPDHLRLSIHPSTDTKKISVALVPQTGGCSMTPWHACLVRSVDGSITMQHAGKVSRTTHTLVIEDGRPSHFRERSDLFDWKGLGVHFDHLYPSGMKITLQDAPLDGMVPLSCLNKLGLLATIHSPLYLSNFERVSNFQAKGVVQDVDCAGF